MARAGVMRQCRLCLRNKKSMVNIFSGSTYLQQSLNIHPLKNVIEDLLNCEVLKADGFPNTICGDCCSKVLGYKSFKAMCLKSREILWRKAQEKLWLEAEKSRTGMENSQDGTPNVCSMSVTEDGSDELNQEVIPYICSLAVVEDGNALCTNGPKREPNEDTGPEGNGGDLFHNNDLSLGCNGRIKEGQSESDLEENECGSLVSTLIRQDGSTDEESFRLRLQSSGSEFSNGGESQATLTRHDGSMDEADLCDDLESSSIRDKSMNVSRTLPITECRVVLTRCDVDKYRRKTEKRRLRKRKPSSVSSAVQPPSEIQPRSNGGFPYRCHDCWITFTSSSSLMKHQRFHCRFSVCQLSRGEKLRTCSQCHSVYTSSRSQRFHSYPAGTAVNCEVCGQTQSTRPQTLSHHDISPLTSTKDPIHVESTSKDTPRRIASRSK